MAGTPKQSGTYAGSMTVRGNNLQNSLGKVNISGLFNSMSDPRGVLTADAQTNDYIDSLLGADPNAYDSDGAVAPTTDSTGSDRKLTSEELRDIFSDNLTAGDIYGDTLAGYEGVRDAVTSAVTAAMQNDYLNSILETQLTPEEKEAQLLGLSVEQMNAKTEDMLDSILSSQGENETGFVNESARLAAEGILKGKIAQAGVTDPAAQEAALKSAMESLEGGASGLEAVKAAAGGAQDFVEGLLKTAKDAVDAGYDKLADFLPEGAMPDTVGVDPTTGQVSAVWGKTSGTPVMGGTVGTQGGGTYAGITTTGSAIVDKLIKVIQSGGDVNSVIEAATGLPSEVVDVAVEGAGAVAKKAAEVLTLDDENDPSKVVLTTTGSEALDPNSTNQVLTVGDDTATDDEEIVGDGVETVTGDEIIDPTSTNQVLTVSDTTKKDDEVLGGGAWQNDGAGSLEEVVGGRVIGPGLDAGGGPDDKVVDDKVLEEVVGPRITGPGLDAGGGPDEVVVDGKVLEEVVGPRITGDPFTFTPILDEEEPPVADEEVPPVLDEEVPPEPPPEVPEIPEAASSFFGVRTKPGEKVGAIDFYDIGGESIFQDRDNSEEEEDPLAFLYSNLGDSGIVQDYDIEELIRYLAETRG